MTISQHAAACGPSPGRSALRAGPSGCHGPVTSMDEHLRFVRCASMKHDHLVLDMPQRQLLTLPLVELAARAGKGPKAIPMLLGIGALVAAAFIALGSWVLVDPDELTDGHYLPPVMASQAAQPDAPSSAATQPFGAQQ